MAARTRHVVAEPDHRLRLDRFVHKARPDLTRRQIEQLLRTGAVRVRGEARDARYFVKRGETVEIGPLPEARAAESAAVAASPDTKAVDAGPRIAPRVVARGPHLVAVAKPPGLPTNPVAARAESLLGWLEAHLGTEPGAARPAHPPGILHRLDRDASGVLLFSLSPEGHRALVAAFRRRRVEKTYRALVGGRVRRANGVIDLPLAAGRGGRVHPSAKGEGAETAYRVLDRGRSWSLLEVRLRSGRTHQIRAHLAAIGHPVAGDALYGDPRRRIAAPRLWLHALIIRLPQALAARLEMPARLSCPLWPDLAAHLSELSTAAGKSGLPGGESDKPVSEPPPSAPAPRR